MPRRGTRRSKRLGRGDWIAAARVALIEGGIEAVKVGRLGRRLGVTRGGFYWHFKNLADLLEALLQAWTRGNTEPLFEAVAAAGDDPRRAYNNVVAVWIDEKDFSPAFDSAVRDWARASSQVAAAVRRIDDRRIGLFQKIFTDMGFDAREAFIRARVSYFHQVGYYALNITESRQQRLALLPLYSKVLTGD